MGKINCCLVKILEPDKNNEIGKVKNFFGIKSTNIKDFKKLKSIVSTWIYPFGLIFGKGNIPRNKMNAKDKK